MSQDEKSKYYDAGGIETFRIIEAKLTQEQYEGFLLGNILKYSCRLNFKETDKGREAEKIYNYSMMLDRFLQKQIT